ncbi:hypothetical protein CN378_22055 [Bacillus sp. AFS015802]|nr:hypothetical protein CN378_22055 [Bacillus sp. AFS015802]
MFKQKVYLMSGRLKNRPFLSDGRKSGIGSRSEEAHRQPRGKREGLRDANISELFLLYMFNRT